MRGCSLGSPSFLSCRFRAKLFLSPILLPVGGYNRVIGSDNCVCMLYRDLGSGMDLQTFAFAMSSTSIPRPALARPRRQGWTPGRRVAGIVPRAAVMGSGSLRFGWFTLTDTLRLRRRARVREPGRGGVLWRVRRSRRASGPGMRRPLHWRPSWHCRRSPSECASRGHRLR